MSLSIKKNSRYLPHIIISLLFVLLSTNPAFSTEQAPVISAFYCSSEEIPFIGELMPHMISTMENDKVKAELGLSNEQIEMMRDVDKGFIAGIKEVLTRNEDNDDEPLRSGGKSENHVMAIGKFSEDARMRTHEILKRNQRARMQELILQLNGVLSIPKKDLRQLLKPDATQERAIDEIRSGIFKYMDETASPEEVVASAGRCKFVISTKQDVAILMEKGEKSVYQLLSPEQKATVEKLQEGVMEAMVACNSPELVADHQADIDRYVSWMDKDMAPGLTAESTYVPGKGFMYTYQGEMKGTIPGSEFMKMYYRTNVGEKAQERVRKGLLGL